jgi:hypothetical protein
MKNFLFLALIAVLAFSVSCQKNALSSKIQAEVEAEYRKSKAE